jgi:glycosyltransferase involved in cell wall biosynthesis
MPSSDLVSIVIPNYNHAQYVSGAVRSALNQTHPRVEVIVVDDGSTDDSAQVIAQFGQAIHAIAQPNQGLSAARNTGIRAATGEFVAALDADDLYEPEFASELVGLLGREPDAVAAYCGYRFVDVANAPLPQAEARRVEPDQLFDQLAAGNFLVPEAMLVRRRCYAQVGPFDQALTALEDLDMWLRIAKAGKVVGTQRLLTRHRILPGSMSTDPSRQHRNRHTVITKHFGAEQQDPAHMFPRQRAAFAAAYLTATIEHLQTRREDKALELFRRMVALAPGLLTELPTLYELACGDQPKGYRGDFATVDITRNAVVLFRLLDAVFEGPVAELEPVRRQTYATANLAIGLLHYGRRELGHARRALLKSLRADPRFLSNRRLLDCLGRSCLASALGRASRPAASRASTASS